MNVRLGLAAAIVASAMALMGPATAQQTLTSTADSFAGANAIAIANGGGGSSVDYPRQAPALGSGSYGSANPCGEWMGGGFSSPFGGLNLNAGSTNRRCQDIQTALQLNQMANTYRDPRFVMAAQLTLCNDPHMRGICANSGLIGVPGQQVAAQPAAYYGHAQPTYAAPAYVEQAYGYAGYGQAQQPSYHAAGYGHAYAARGPMIPAYIAASVPASEVRPPWCATSGGQRFKYPEC